MPGEKLSYYEPVQEPERVQDSDSLVQNEIIEARLRLGEFFRVNIIPTINLGTAAQILNTEDIPFAMALVDSGFFPNEPISDIESSIKNSIRTAHREKKPSRATGRFRLTAFEAYEINRHPYIRTFSLEDIEGEHIDLNLQQLELVVQRFKIRHAAPSEFSLPFEDDKYNTRRYNQDKIKTMKFALRPPEECSIPAKALEDSQANINNIKLHEIAAEISLPLGARRFMNQKTGLMEIFLTKDDTTQIFKYLLAQSASNSEG
jgi:hypothetical protein